MSVHDHEASLVLSAPVIYKTMPFTKTDNSSKIEAQCGYPEDLCKMNASTTMANIKFSTTVLHSIMYDQKYRNAAQGDGQYKHGSFECMKISIQQQLQQHEANKPHLLF